MKKRTKERRRKDGRKNNTTTETPRDTTTVLNLSGQSLSEEENILLSKGLSFCPTPRRLDENQLLDHLESFFRRLRLREFFLDLEDEENNERNAFHPPSKWIPPKGRDESGDLCEGSKMGNFATAAASKNTECEG